MTKKAAVAVKQGLLPTPPLPTDLPSIDLSENSMQVLERRYLRRGEDGKPVETVDEMFWRVSYHVAKAEEQWEGDVIERARDFYRLLVSKKFFPNSPTFTGAGTPLGQLAACFVLPVNDDMGRDAAGIFQSLRDAALIQQTGGGNGFSFSRLRPKGTLVNSSAGQATGPVGFLRVYDHAFGEIAQGGTRRGANMGVLRVDHTTAVIERVPADLECALAVFELGQSPDPDGAIPARSAVQDPAGHVLGAVVVNTDDARGLRW